MAIHFNLKNYLLTFFINQLSHGQIKITTLDSSIMKSSGINKFGIGMAVLSFAIGTFLFISYLLFPSPILHGILAFFYFIIATILNFITLGVLFISALVNEDHRKNTLLTSVLLIINIPVQILYFMIIIN